MIRWLRVTWPPAWILLLALIGWCGFEGFTLVFEWQLNMLLMSSRDANPAIVLGMALALFAIYRVMAFHPAFRPGYRDWLLGTPWSIQKPLPMGPVHLVWQDVLLVALAVGLAWPRSQLSALNLVAAFAFAYFAMLMFAHFASGERLWAYAVGAGIGFMIFVANDRLSLAAAAGLTYLVALGGLHAALARFPWGDALMMPVIEKTSGGQIIIRKSYAEELVQRQFLGWHLSRLGPRVISFAAVPIRDVLLTGLLAGWWFFCLSWQLKLAGRYVPALAFILMQSAVAFAAMMRVAVYCDGFLPPISLRGRFLTGRWIIPGYDQVLVAPLVALSVGLADMLVAFLFGESALLVAIPVTLTVCWWIIGGLGPDLQTWRLTGEHRVTAGMPNTALTQ